jgi:N-acetylglucosamine kinase-like BadF-type ATPase
VTRPAVLAVDGGGSKIDVALVGRNGDVLGASRIANPDPEHGSPYLDRIVRAVESAVAGANLDPERRPVAPVGVFCLAGADLGDDERRLLRWLSKQAWAEEDVIRNDTFAIMRTGSDRSWGVGVVCGTGTNCVAIAPDGRTFRIPALGQISGDWGGGGDLGRDALWYAVRAEDGRGSNTELARLVPAHFDLRRPRQVTEAIHFGRLEEARLSELTPLVFRAASRDPVARSLVDRQADEIVTMAGTAIRRLDLGQLDVHVTLGGGVLRNRFAPFLERIRTGIRTIAPLAQVSVVTDPPVVGAALIGLDRAGAPSSGHRRLRAVLTHERLRTHTRR